MKGGQEARKGETMKMNWKENYDYEVRKNENDNVVVEITDNQDNVLRTVEVPTCDFLPMIEAWCWSWKTLNEEVKKILEDKAEFEAKYGSYEE